MDSIMIVAYISVVSLMFILILILLLTRRPPTYNLYVPHTPMPQTDSFPFPQFGHVDQAYTPPSPMPQTDPFPFPQFGHVDQSYTPPTSIHQTDAIPLPQLNPIQSNPGNIYVEMRGSLLPLYSNYPFVRSTSLIRDSDIYYSDD